MKKVMVTGVAGFIGSHVAKNFLTKGYHVIGVDDLSSGNISNIPDDVEFINADLSEKAFLNLIPPKIELILHLAGQSSGEISFDDPIADLKKNTNSTLNLINYGILNKSERLVYASSMSVYGSVQDTPINEDFSCAPLSCYGVGKLAAESYLRIYQNKLPSVALRMFNVYGPGQDLSNLRQGMISVYLAQALKNKKIIVKGSENRFRDFIYIEDVVESWFLASKSDQAIGQVLNIGTGVKTTVKNVLELICKEIPGTEILIAEGTPGDQSGIYADNFKMKHCLQKDSFVPLEIGLKKFTNWARGSI